jgi:hypothetical protein
MTEEMRKLLTDQLDGANTRDDIDRALVSSMKALIDCQYKTAERVKDLVVERDREKQRRNGALWLWGVLSAAVAAGGGARILKAMQLFQVVQQ